MEDYGDSPLVARLDERTAQLAEQQHEIMTMLRAIQNERADQRSLDDHQAEDIAQLRNLVEALNKTVTLLNESIVTEHADRMKQTRYIWLAIIISWLVQFGINSGAAFNAVSNLLALLVP